MARGLRGAASAIIIGGNLIRCPCDITTDSFCNAALISDNTAAVVAPTIRHTYGPEYYTHYVICYCCAVLYSN